MSFDLQEDKTSVKCPKCNSEAVYRYGKTRHGKQRFRCLLCGRQFGDGAANGLATRPACPSCGKKMHIYRKGATEIRFRCSAYPACRTFTKIGVQEYEQFLWHNDC
ncbi:MAG: IS1/IS1595 family N-terminal zinc-binding domain-containing protein [Syntrophobacteraceae bacterium]